MNAKPTILISSIGNPEKLYLGTRHNVAHLLLKYLIEEHWKNHIFKSNEYYKSKKYENILLFKSNKTFMNLQGEIIKEKLDSLPPNTNVIIAHDDIQVKLGNFQFRIPETSSRGHNGLKSIDNYILNSYYKISIGIGKPKLQPVDQFVLNKFTNDELNTIITKTFPKLINALEIMIEKKIHPF